MSIAIRICARKILHENIQLQKEPKITTYYVTLLYTDSTVSYFRVPLPSLRAYSQFRDGPFMRKERMFSDCNPTIPPENLDYLNSHGIDEILTEAIKARNFSQIGLILTESDHLPGLENAISSVRPRTHGEAADLFHSPAAFSIWMTWNLAASLPWLSARVIGTGSKSASWEQTSTPAAKQLGKILWMYQELLVYSFGFESAKALPDDVRDKIESLKGWSGQQAFAPWMPMLLIRAAHEFPILWNGPWLEMLTDLKRRDMRQVNKLKSRCERIRYGARHFYDESVRGYFDLSEVQLTFADDE